MLDVVVVGSGAAGLAAAQELEIQGISYHVLEARSSIGGRAATDVTTLGYPVDLGCHWLHSPGHNPFTKIAADFGVRVKKDGQDHFVIQNGQVLDTGEAEQATQFVEICFARLKDAAALPTDMSVAAFLNEQHSRWWPLFEHCFLGKQAVMPDQASAKDFAAYVWEGGDWPVLDGLGAVVQRHAKHIPVELNSPVVRIHWGGAGVRIDTAKGQIEARGVIVTASTSVLARGKIIFDPPLPEAKRNAIESLPMGSCNKVALRFEKDMFGTRESAMVLPDTAQTKQIELILQPGGHNGVVALISGPCALELGRQGRQAMIDFTLSRLQEIYGSTIRKNVAPEALVMNWDAEDYIGGCWATAIPGAAEARKTLVEPLNKRVYFAGEATSQRYAGDVHGAHFSGIEAARLFAQDHGRVAFDNEQDKAL